MIVLLYLGAVVAANLSVASFGPGATIVNALVLIGLDLTARDRLHDAWHGRYLWPRMLALIATGGAISYLVNQGAAQIAVASCVAFTLAGVVDAAVYALLGNKARLVRVNGSNVLSAAVDSSVFVLLAFGPATAAIIPLQWVAKVGGGFMWSLVLGGNRAVSPARRGASTGREAA